MPQAVWVGTLSFGLVNIPIKLYSATSPRRVSFHQYEAGSGRRVRYRRMVEGPPLEDVTAVDSNAERARSAEDTEPLDEREPVSWEEAEDEDFDDETEVAWEDVVKGYEIEPGRVVTVDQEELESVAPERSRVIEVEQFVDLSDIDPVHFEKSYYVVSQRGAVTERPYWLLYRAMEEAGKVAIGRFVLRTKEYLVAVRPGEHVLMLETLYYADEVRDPKEVWVPSSEEPSDKELVMARQLLEALAGQWVPDRHRDEHRERLLDLIHSKAGEAVTAPESAEAEGTQLSDLMATLQASVAAARRAREEEGRHAG